MAAADDLVATRIALHSVAEHVLAAALHSWNGRIGLRATPGGFGTPEVEVDGVIRRVRVAGTDLVVEADGTARREPLTTLAAAAAHAGVSLGAPEGLYEIVTVVDDPDAPLAVDGAAAHLIADWFALVEVALRAFAADVAPDDPPRAQLWPEHLDLALTHDEVNYGGSPGDGAHPEPYLYVGPWALAEPDGFWNETWGRSWSHAEVPDAPAATALLHAGRARSDQG